MWRWPGRPVQAADSTKGVLADGDRSGISVPLRDPAAWADAGARDRVRDAGADPGPATDHALEQVANVAELPGIVEASYAMPDVHWGYGFPIGGVAATDVADGGVVSPGGVGFDISCGVRLLAAELGRDELAPVLGRVMDGLAAVIPRRHGPRRHLAPARPGELDKLLAGGAAYAVACGHGCQRDLDRCEDRGAARRRRPGAGQPPGHRPRAAPGRQPGLGKPFPRGPGGGRRSSTRRPRRCSGWPTGGSAS